MSNSTLNMSYLNHYLDKICYLQDNYRLDVAAIVMRDILKCRGRFNISSHMHISRPGDSGLISFFASECISLIAFHSHFISNARIGGCFVCT